MITTCTSSLLTGLCAIPGFFKTKSKHPPINIAQTVLDKFKVNHPYCTVCIDQGKEIDMSQDFRNTIDAEGFQFPIIKSLHTHISPPYHAKLSPYLYDNKIHIPIPLHGNHKTLYLALEIDKDMSRIRLNHCIPDTTAAKVPKWRLILKH